MAPRLLVDGPGVDCTDKGHGHEPLRAVAGGRRQRLEQLRKKALMGRQCRRPLEATTLVVVSGRHSSDHRKNWRSGVPLPPDASMSTPSTNGRQVAGAEQHQLRGQLCVDLLDLVLEHVVDRAGKRAPQRRCAWAA